jgi:hypothetical protein
MQASIGERVEAVKQAAQAIVDVVKKQGDTLGLDVKLDTAVFQLFKAGGAVPTDVQKLVGLAMREHMSRLSENGMMVRLAGDVVEVTELTKATSALAATDPKRTAAVKQIHHITSRYDGIRITQRMQSSWDSLQSLVATLAKKSPSTLSNADNYMARARALMVQLEAGTREKRDIVYDAKKMLEELQAKEERGILQRSDVMLANTKRVLNRIVATISTQNAKTLSWKI